MKKLGDITIHFEPGDPSVGIFGEDFSAWVEKSTAWVQLNDYNPDPKQSVYTWFDSETDEEIPAPWFANILESALHGTATAYYSSQEDDEESPKLMSRQELQEHRQTHTKENSWWLKDARGIEVCRVCGECEESAKAQYNPAIFGEGRDSYEDVVQEPIEPED